MDLSTAKNYVEKNCFSDRVTIIFQNNANKISFERIWRAKLDPCKRCNCFLQGDLVLWEFQEVFIVKLLKISYKSLESAE